jgi:hypothetical protein
MHIESQKQGQVDMPQRGEMLCHHNHASLSACSGCHTKQQVGVLPQPVTVFYVATLEGWQPGLLPRQPFGHSFAIGEQLVSAGLIAPS